jgi:hypothetical protein
MRGLSKFACLSVLALPLAAAPFSVSTGSAAWQVSQTTTVGSATNNGTALGTSSAAVALVGALPGSWLAPPAGSAWIGQRTTDGCNTFTPNENCGATPGTYVYSLSFAPGQGGSFSFGFASDNVVTSLTVIQNGTTLYTFGPGSAPMHTSLINSTLINFGSTGNVVISATVRNDSFDSGPPEVRNPSGLLVSGSGDMAEGIPEPSTYAMLTLGGMALVAARLRRK